MCGPDVYTLTGDSNCLVYLRATIVIMTYTSTHILIMVRPAYMQQLGLSVFRIHGKVGVSKHKACC